MDTLHVHAGHLTAKNGMGAPIAIARVCAGNPAETRHDVLVLDTPGLPRTITKAGVADAAERAAASERQAPGVELLDGLPPLLRATHFFARTSFTQRVPDIDLEVAL